MKKFSQLLSVSVAAVAFSACGGGGGSSPAPTGSSNIAPNGDVVPPSSPSSTTQQRVVHIGDSGGRTLDSFSLSVFHIGGKLFRVDSSEVGIAGSTRVVNDEYIYKFNGQEFVFANDSSNNLQLLSDNPMTVIANGGRYSYMTFGLIKGLEDAYESTEAFYFGKETSSGSVPTVGTARFNGNIAGYNGDRIGLADANGVAIGMAVSFDVDYGNKTIEGEALYGDSAGRLAFEDGTISGNRFSGDLHDSDTRYESYVVNGEFEGSFFGPNAEQLGGIATLYGVSSQDEDIVLPFGAKRE